MRVDEWLTDDGSAGISSALLSRVIEGSPDRRAFMQAKGRLVRNAASCGGSRAGQGDANGGEPVGLWRRSRVAGI
ncbi:hypothetical protein SBA_ch2_5200 [Sphingomonas bisphenolicum]|uniref:Uncharacterized protein n=2 Tax=Sphingomonas bisphenolicum TaxID=296544 RepID=A0ABM7G7F3_9SPHN|nr:hypothetical protein SBA_ch2_5200 [Sphingomonas bisphenolicum]